MVRPFVKAFAIGVPIALAVGVVVGYRSIGPPQDIQNVFDERCGDHPVIFSGNKYAIQPTDIAPRSYGSGISAEHPLGYIDIVRKLNYPVKDTGDEVCWADAMLARNKIIPKPGTVIEVPDVPKKS